jgi:hypothetical protein
VRLPSWLTVPVLDTTAAAPAVAVAVIVAAVAVAAAAAVGKCDMPPSPPPNTSRWRIAQPHFEHDTLTPPHAPPPFPQTALANLIAAGKASNKALLVTGCVPQGDRKAPELQGLSLLGVAQIDRWVGVFFLGGGTRNGLTHPRRGGGVAGCGVERLAGDGMVAGRGVCPRVTARHLSCKDLACWGWHRLTGVCGEGRGLSIPAR